MNDQQSIFIDSDIFIASVKETDSNHQKVKTIFEKLVKRPVTFYTSNYVFSECITVLSQRIGKTIAHQFIKDMKSSDAIFSVLWITERIEEKAIDIFLKQTSKNVSFVDCTNMALIELNHIHTVFSFDQVYKKNGYKILNH